jgi:hypothetical protein
MAVADGVRAAQAARQGVGGDPDLLDGPWLRDAHSLNADPTALTANLGRGSIYAQLSLKPFCSAKQAVAATEALMALKRSCSAELHTDSEYLRKGITEWIGKWKANGWRTASRDPVKNADLWQALDEARQRHKVSWHWIKGHAGEVENERADELAREGMTPYKKR